MASAVPCEPLRGIRGCAAGRSAELAGHARGDFGEAHARDRGGDGAELAADAGRGVGLGVERVVMAGAAERPDQDAVDVLDLLPARGGPCWPASRPGSDRPRPESVPMPGRRDGDALAIL